MPNIILNFHGVGPLLRHVDRGENECWLEHSQFLEVLDLLRNKPRVQITFDDGNASDVDYALPALLERKLHATFFVCSKRLDQPTFLRRDDLTSLLSHEMGIGCHGATHIPWRGLSATELQQEITESRDTLESTCGIGVDRAACPFGSYDHRVLQGLRTAGYRTVYTSDGGIARDRWLQARTTVTRSTPLDTLRQLVEHGPGRLVQLGIDLRTLLKSRR